MTGVALAVELLIQGLVDADIPFVSVDTTFFNRTGRSGTFSSLRALETLLVILRVWCLLPLCRIYYTTMSTSVFGFARDYLTVLAAKLMGRRIVLHLHGGGFEDFYRNQSLLVQSLIRSNLCRVDTIIVLGELLKEQFDCVGEFVQPKLVVVPNGLTLGVDEPVACGRRLSSNGPIQLLYLSSLMPSKGFLDVLQAMKLLADKEADRYHLHLCGGFVDASTEVNREVTNQEELKRYLKKYDIEGCVTYHSQVTGLKKKKRFEEASIFLLPTSYPWEGQPLSIIEAEAFSVPVISCYHKGIPEQVVDGKSGRLVPPRNPRAIANAVREICATDERYLEYSQAARGQYELNFKRDVHLSRMFDAIGLV
jgi:glycosyltransferase involved in cell wall biosynthesis